MGGLVAQDEAEADGGGVVRHLQAVLLHVESALRAPVVLGHFFDQDFFGAGGGVVLVDEIEQELNEFGFVFVGEGRRSVRLGCACCCWRRKRLFQLLFSRRLSAGR